MMRKYHVRARRGACGPKTLSWTTRLTLPVITAHGLLIGTPSNGQHSCGASKLGELLCRAGDNNLTLSLLSGMASQSGHAKPNKIARAIVGFNW